MSQKRIRKAIIPVAGLGTRFLPATKSMPKEMLTVVDKPAIQYVFDEAREAGIEHIVFVTGRNKGVIEDHFDIAFELEETLHRRNKQDALNTVVAARPQPGQTSFTRQQEPLGLGHAVWCARDIVGNEPFALLLPDVLIQAERGCLSQMNGRLRLPRRQRSSPSRKCPPTRLTSTASWKSATATTASSASPAWSRSRLRAPRRRT